MKKWENMREVWENRTEESPTWWRRRMCNETSNETWKNFLTGPQFRFPCLEQKKNPKPERSAFLTREEKKWKCGKKSFTSVDRRQFS